MDAQKVDMYLMANQKYFPADRILFLKQKLLEVSDDKFLLASTVELKDPTTLFLVSFFLGGLGVDRFMIGDTGMGVLKLLTGGVCGILAIIDWCTISKKARDKNFATLMQIL